MSRLDPVTAADRAAVAAQLGRPPRALRAVAHRCPCGHPSVIQTSPRLADGTPFPTLYYLTCTRLRSLVGRLEASGLMAEMTDRLRADGELAAAYRRAHESYLAERDAMESLGTEVSAGGMPGRIKCLHALLAHTLARGPGVNPFGDETLARVDGWWAGGPCVPVTPDLARIWRGRSRVGGSDPVDEGAGVQPAGQRPETAPDLGAEPAGDETLRHRPWGVPKQQ